MAKLNTYVENIQLKSNKVDADIPSKDWTEEQYPSARSLYQAFDKIHPIGSVLCMSENTNPAQLYEHGTWELIDKELESRWVQIYEGQGWNNINGHLSTSSSGTSAAYLAGHSLTIRLLISLDTPMTNDTEFEVGTINPNFIGLTELPMDKIGIPFTIDGGEIVGNASIPRTGTVKLNDGWHIVKASDGTLTFERNVSTDFSVPIHVSYTIPHDKMLDSFCNKFYFKRVA